MLFLAEITTESVQYMGQSTLSNSFWRLVRAESADEAKEKIVATFEKGDPYGTSTYVVSVEIHPTIE